MIVVRAGETEMTSLKRDHISTSALFQLDFRDSRFGVSHGSYRPTVANAGVLKDWGCCRLLRAQVLFRSLSND